MHYRIGDGAGMFADHEWGEVAKAVLAVEIPAVVPMRRVFIAWFCATIGTAKASPVPTAGISITWSSRGNARGNRLTQAAPWHAKCISARGSD